MKGNQEGIDSKISKIPVLLKKAKVLKPVKNKMGSFCSDNQLIDCHNCKMLEKNLNSSKQNISTLMKENYLLRKQLAALTTSVSKANTTPINVTSVEENSSITNSNSVPISPNSSINITDLFPSPEKLPYHLFDSNPFKSFDLNELDSSCSYNKFLDNRTLAYYGTLPYRYGEIYHEPQPFNSNPYLCKILEHANKFLPGLDFNSALITKFNNGSNYLNFHSDNETEICENSYIATISLGMSIAVKFKSIGPNNNLVSTLNAIHGSFYIMTSESQKFFQHSVPPDTSNLPRISITLRNLKPPKPHNKSRPFVAQPHTTQSSLDTRLETAANRPNNNNPKTKTLYISSSMFSGLNESKLSSNSQEATVLFYRGATAGGILDRLKCDPKFHSIDPKSVNNIFIMCGTNNVDNILHIPFGKCSSFVRKSDTNFDQNLFNIVTQEYNQIYKFLHTWNTNATINFVNVLPRVSSIRNEVINKLNNYLYSQCNKTKSANFIDTEYDRNLFCKNSFRNNIYFSNAGSDNVHLNNAGVIHIGKHLKYLAHN